MGRDIIYFREADGKYKLISGPQMFKLGDAQYACCKHDHKQWEIWFKEEVWLLAELVARISNPEEWGLTFVPAQYFDYDFLSTHIDKINALVSGFIKSRMVQYSYDSTRGDYFIYPIQVLMLLSLNSIVLPKTCLYYLHRNQQEFNFRQISLYYNKKKIKVPVGNKKLRSDQIQMNEFLNVCLKELQINPTLSTKEILSNDAVVRQRDLFTDAEGQKVFYKDDYLRVLINKAIKDSPGFRKNCEVGDHKS